MPGLYAAGDMASVPHNYMLGAFVYGWFAGQNAAAYCRGQRDRSASTATRSRPSGTRRRAARRAARACRRTSSNTRLRRMVNDYLQPPKVTRKMQIGLERFAEIGEDMNALIAAEPARADARDGSRHTSTTAPSMAAHASLFRTESRWGLYHYRVDYPERNDAELVHATATCARTRTARMESIKRPVEPYILPLDDEEKTAYQRLRDRQGSGQRLTA